MRKYIGILSLLFISILGKAQTATIQFNGVKSQDRKHQPLVIVNDRQTHPDKFLINPKFIKTVYILKEGEAKKQYGDLAKNGVVRVALKPEAKMYNLDEILEEFHVNPKHRNLRVCIDKDIIDHPELLMADLNEIDDVVIASGRYLGFTDASTRQEPFIYITRKKLKEVSL